MPTRRAWYKLLLLIALVVLSLLLAAGLGSSRIGWGDWMTVLAATDSPASQIVWQLRLPRALAAFTVGAALATAGVLMQVLLRNPLADPYILGVSGGAATAALLTLVAGLGVALLPITSSIGALVAMLLVFGLSHGSGPWSATRLLLTGVVLAAGWGAINSLILAISPDQNLRGMLFWLMGDLSFARIRLWAPVVTLICWGLAFTRARSLNALALGEHTATLLGENSRRLQWLIFILGSVLTAVAVSLAGSVGFVGLIVPHMMRLWAGADHRVLLPAAALFGGSFLVLADTLARTVIAPQQLPVGVITAIIGVPLFLLLLNRARVQS